MRNIFDIISKLSKEEKRSFKLFLKRANNYQEDNKVAQLFDFVNLGTCSTDEELAERLYPENNKNAYYRLKKRMIGDLESSLLILHADFDEQMTILNQLAIAKIYAHKSLFKDALSILQKAEKKALALDHFDLLTTIYNNITKMAFEYDEIDLQKYLDKQSQNLENYNGSLKISQLLHYLSYRLTKSNYDLRDEDISEKLAQLQKQLSIDEHLIQSPKIQLKISKCISKALLQKRDFKSLEQYLIANLKDFESKNIYKQNHLEKIIVFVWIINTLFKNLKFVEAAIYAEQLHEALLAHQKRYYGKYIWTYYQCLVTQYFYSNQCLKAIELLEVLAAENTHKGVLYYDLFVRLNLATIYLCCKQIDKAMTSIAPLFYKETFKSLSQELQLRLLIVEIILHYENKDFNFLDYKINDIRKSFRRLLKQDHYKREKNFIHIIKKAIRYPNPFKDKRILKLITAFSESSPPFEPGSNESVNYQLWLEAKINHKNYYQTILERVQL